MEYVTRPTRDEIEPRQNLDSMEIEKDKESKAVENSSSIELISEFPGESVFGIREVRALVRLYFLNRPTAKGVLEEVLFNLCEYKKTREIVIGSLLRILLPLDLPRIRNSSISSHGKKRKKQDGGIDSHDRSELIRWVPRQLYGCSDDASFSLSSSREISLIIPGELGTRTLCLPPSLVTGRILNSLINLVSSNRVVALFYNRLEKIESNKANIEDISIDKARKISSESAYSNTSKISEKETRLENPLLRLYDSHTVESLPYLEQLLMLLSFEEYCRSSLHLGRIITLLLGVTECLEKLERFDEKNKNEIGVELKVSDIEKKR